jgi:hypothetical protein
MRTSDTKIKDISYGNLIIARKEKANFTHNRLLSPLLYIYSINPFSFIRIFGFAAKSM